MLNLEVRSFKKEIFRKIIHFLGVGYIPLYILIGRFYLIIFISIALLLFLALEILRKRDSRFFPSFLLRDYEREKIGAHIYFGISALIITIFLPMDACFIGIVASSIGDGVSGIIKRMKLNKFKALPTISMFLSSTVVFLFMYLIILKYYIKVAEFAMFLSFLISSLVERQSKILGKYIDDNITVPISASFSYFFLNYLL